MTNENNSRTSEASARSLPNDLAEKLAALSLPFAAREFVRQVYNAGFLDGYTVDDEPCSGEASPPQCFHNAAGKPCTRYLEGARGEREQIVKWLRTEAEVSGPSGYGVCAKILHELAGNIENGMAKRSRRERAPSPVSCRCGMYAGACPLHDHDYRESAEKAIEEDRAKRSPTPDPKASLDVGLAGEAIIMWARYWSETPNARHAESLRNAVERYESTLSVSKTEGGTK